MDVTFAPTQERGATLWAMAVLRVLKVEDFLLLEPILQRFIGVIDHAEFHPFLIGQLRQVILELRIQARARLYSKPYIILTHMTDELSSNLMSLNEPISDENYKSIYTERIWETIKYKAKHNSSMSHIEVSKALNILGEMHENEMLLEYGLLVDIFISKPASRSPPLLSPLKESSTAAVVAKVKDEEMKTENKCRGIVIEVDGPFHFDSYLYVSILSYTSRAVTTFI